MYTVKMNYELNDEITTWDNFSEAHDFAMCKWFWGAAGFSIYDANGKCVEIR